MDAGEFTQAGKRHFRQRFAVAAQLKPRFLLARLVRAASEFRKILPELTPGLTVLRRRQCFLMLARRLCLCAAEIPRTQFLVRAHARHLDAAVSCDAHSAIYPVPQPRLDRHLPAADRAEIPGSGRVLCLSPRAVLPLDPARARRGRDDRRLRAVADLLDGDRAAVAARTSHRGDLHLHMDLGRFLRPAGLPQRHELLHGAARPAQFCRFHRKVGLGRAVRDVDADAAAGVRLLPVLPAPAD